VLLAAMLALMPPWGALAQEVKNVLVIYDDDPTLPYVKAFDPTRASAGAKFCQECSAPLARVCSNRSGRCTYPVE
jgi:hypothetical protein